VLRSCVDPSPDRERNGACPPVARTMRCPVAGTATDQRMNHRRGAGGGAADSSRETLRRRRALPTARVPTPRAAALAARDPIPARHRPTDPAGEPDFGVARSDRRVLPVPEPTLTLGSDQHVVVRCARCAVTGARCWAAPSDEGSNLRRCPSRHREPELTVRRGCVLASLPRATDCREPRRLNRGARPPSSSPGSADPPHGAAWRCRRPWFAVRRRAPRTGPAAPSASGARRRCPRRPRRRRRW
jgi:hypothetical protein